MMPTSISWEEASKGLWFLLPVVGILSVLLLVLDVGRRPKQKRVEIKRFLEWAKLDVEEEKSNRAVADVAYKACAAHLERLASHGAKPCHADSQQLGK